MGVFSRPYPLAKRKLRKSLDKTPPLGAISALRHWDSVLRKWDSDTRVTNLLLGDETRILSRQNCKAALLHSSSSGSLQGEDAFHSRLMSWVRHSQKAASDLGIGRILLPQHPKKCMVVGWWCGAHCSEKTQILSRYCSMNIPFETRGIFPLSQAQSFWKCFLAADKALSTSKA